MLPAAGRRYHSSQRKSTKTLRQFGPERFPTAWVQTMGMGSRSGLARLAFWEPALDRRSLIPQSGRLFKRERAAGSAVRSWRHHHANQARIAIAAAAALAASALAILPASADPMWGGHGHWHHGADVGFGFSFGGPYYGYDGYYAPGYAYDYGEPCLRPAGLRSSGLRLQRRGGVLRLALPELRPGNTHLHRLRRLAAPLPIAL